MKTALVHDWLVCMGGAEKVLESMSNTFQGDFFTLIYDNKKDFSFLRDKKIKETFIKRLPFAQKRYRSYLPFFPLAIEQMDLNKYDLILSSSHCVAKGVLTHLEQLHICYCHSPVRYAWDLYHQYLKEGKLKKGIKGAIAKIILHYLRNWDISSSSRVDHYIANSKFIARRIKKVYGRAADVIYPPVDVNRFKAKEKREKYFVTASRLVPYKKIDLIVKAFSKLPNERLLVVGDGPDMARVKQAAKNSLNIEIMGYQKDNILTDILQKAKGFIFAAVEDFGIIPVEAQACGAPVIALNRGGTKETIINNKTGVLFENQTEEDIINAVDKLNQNYDQFDPTIIREHSLKFSKDRFEKEYKSFVEEKYKIFKSKL